MNAMECIEIILTNKQIYAPKPYQNSKYFRFIVIKIIKLLVIKQVENSNALFACFLGTPFINTEIE